jgi:hypothetical protein
LARHWRARHTENHDVRRGRFFPAEFSAESLERFLSNALLADNGLSEVPTPFVTPEDILLAKLDWFRAGSEVSEVQWRDIRAIVRSRRGITGLLERALKEA